MSRLRPTARHAQRESSPVLELFNRRGGFQHRIPHRRQSLALVCYVLRQGFKKRRNRHKSRLRDGGSHEDGCWCGHRRHAPQHWSDVRQVRNGESLTMIPEVTLTEVHGTFIQRDRNRFVK